MSGLLSQHKLEECALLRKAGLPLEKVAQEPSGQPIGRNLRHLLLLYLLHLMRVRMRLRLEAEAEAEAENGAEAEGG